jgi:hypothetical protein
VFERLVVPDQVGDFTISPATLVYFDPIAGEYRTITSAPLPVRVIPAPTPEPTVIAAPTAAATSIANLTATTPLPSQRTREPALVISPGAMQNLVWPMGFFLLMGLCGALPLAAALGAGGVWWWQQRQRAGATTPPPKITRLEKGLKQPRQMIHPGLAAAMRVNDDNYKTINQAINGYLSTALQTPVNGLTHGTDSPPQEAGLSERLIERGQSCLAQSEMGRYGPTTDDAGWSLMAETDALLRE